MCIWYNFHSHQNVVQKTPFFYTYQNLDTSSAVHLHSAPTRIPDSIVSLFSNRPPQIPHGICNLKRFGIPTLNAYTDAHKKHFRIASSRSQHTIFTLLRNVLLGTSRLSHNYHWCSSYSIRFNRYFNVFDRN